MSEESNNEDDNELKNSDLSVPKFNINNQIFLAKCVKCYDGDTIHIVIRYNNVLQRFVCRLAEIDTPEIKSKDINEKNHAYKAKEFLINLIYNKLIYVKCGNFDKYGRLLIYIYLEKKDILKFEKSVNELLVKEKLAYRYNIKKSKIKFIDWFNK